jgi:tetratricopeptide (TPR) repeat protein
MAEHHGAPTYQIHALDYLAYAYLQRGQESLARQVVALDDVTGADVNLLASMRGWLAARGTLDLHRWDEAVNVDIPSGTFRAISAWWARTIGAARLGNVNLARQNLAALRQAVMTNNTAMRAAGNSTLDIPVELEEGIAWTAYVEGRYDDAIAGLRRAADREAADGGESITVPAREMLGDLFIAIGRPVEALDAYRAALTHAPNRFDSLYGAAQAAAAAEDISDAKNYYAQLVRVSAPTADRLEIQEAKGFLAAH